MISTNRKTNAVVWSLVVGGAIASSLSLGYVHPFGNPRIVRPGLHNILEGEEIPASLRRVLGTKCGDCHSEGTIWPIYARFAPASWLLENDVSRAREHLNVSRWAQYSEDKKVELLSEMGLKAREGTMPPLQYRILHPERKLTDAERAEIFIWSKQETRRERRVEEKSEDTDASEK